MPRRVSVPTADELFRPTVVADQAAVDDARPEDAGSEDGAVRPKRAPSGRVRHDEKMTVYVTADELLDLEHARLSLRRAGLSVDRGRLVRLAIAIALADLDENGDESAIMHRLTQS